MLIAALFTIAKIRKQPKVLVNKRMDKEDEVHIYSKILFSHKKRNKIILFIATWLALEFIMLGKVSQTWKNKYDHNSYV